MYVVVSKLHFFSRTFITRYISGVGEVISYSGGVFLNFLPRCQWDIFTGSDSSSLSNTSFGHAPVFSDVWVSYGKRINFFFFFPFRNMRMRIWAAFKIGKGRAIREKGILRIYGQRFFQGVLYSLGDFMFHSGDIRGNLGYECRAFSWCLCLKVMWKAVEGYKG